MSALSRESSDPELDEAPLPARETDLLLTDISHLLTCDASMRRFSPGAAAIEGDTLVAVGPDSEVRARFRGRREMSLGGYLVMPGLVNTHCHAAMSLFRGLADDLPLDRWLHEVIFPAESNHVNPDLVYAGTLLSCAEMLLGGTTTFCDGYFFEEAAARAAIDAGIRAVLGQGILDFPTPDEPNPAKAIERAERFLRDFPTTTDRVRPSLFCHAPYTCGPDTLRRAKSICRERGILFQTHLSETASEVEEITRKYGMRPTFHLDRLGILDESTLCAHAIWVTPEEIALLAERAVSVSHTVESNMKLASGVAPTPEMIRAGVNVSLGTDGCASNNDLDLFGEMDRAAKLHKVFSGSPVELPASEALKMATRSGAAALRLQSEIGSLEPGKKADLIAIDLNRPRLTPLYDPVSHLVYAVKPTDVGHVWVNGRRLVSEGRLTDLDIRTVIREAKRIAGKIRR